jgi:hypothetical protein
MLQTKMVQVTEVWGVEGSLPVTPMGTTDRAAASSLPCRVCVYDVHPESCAISRRSPFR